MVAVLLDNKIWVSLGAPSSLAIDARKRIASNSLDDTLVDGFRGRGGIYISPTYIALIHIKNISNPSPTFTLLS
ncbi:MAG TPA: hypothetical protein VKZ95_00800 [Sphingobacteriaceae bacterium]|nr:hypothetical protein [Sphingobacteriaceae bacterium]